MITNLYRLIDNRWNVKMFRQVDRRYIVIATRFGQPDRSVLPKIEIDGPEEDPTLTQVDDGIPIQRATGATLEEALENLCNQLFMGIKK